MAGIEAGEARGGGDEEARRKGLREGAAEASPVGRRMRGRREWDGQGAVRRRHGVRERARAISVPFSRWYLVLGEPLYP